MPKKLTLLLSFFLLLLLPRFLSGEVAPLPGGGEANPEVLPKSAPVDVLGTTGYYRWRYSDFMGRHPGLKEPDPEHIPDYYLVYGEKYVLRFSRNLYPKLSDLGKEWLVKTRLGLQMAIENRCQADRKEFKELEENPPEFRTFAFDTHVSAYMNGGLADLPLRDLLKIGVTPELKDILRKEGRTQIFAISRRLGKAYWKRVLSLTRNVHSQLSQIIREGDPVPVEQALDFVETLSPLDQKMVRFVTRNYHALRQGIQFQANHAEQPHPWNNLLERLNSLSGKE